MISTSWKALDTTIDQKKRKAGAIKRDQKRGKVVGGSIIQKMVEIIILGRNEQAKKRVADHGPKRALRKAKRGVAPL